MTIGITGTLGAGKGTVVNYLIKNRGFKHLSARAYFQEKMEKAGMPIDRDSMAAFANDLREKNGPDFVFRELHKQAKEMGGNVIIESLRTPAEAVALKGEPDSYLLAIDADQKLRFERIHKRASTLDLVTFEKFQEQEAKEMTSNNPYEQNIAAVIAMADHTIYNDNHTELLYQEVDKFLERIN